MDNRTAIVINCGVGNVDSVVNSISRVGVNAVACSEASELRSVRAGCVVLPGVGTFGQMMRLLHDGGWIETLSELVHERKLPFLGICVGMQVLAVSSEEFGFFRGLGWIDGHVKNLSHEEAVRRVPHVGWNNVNFTSLASEFEALNGYDFYFVHSFHFCANESSIAGQAKYGIEFVCMVKKDNLMGVQFHPEKSASSGKKFFASYFDSIGFFQEC